MSDYLWEKQGEPDPELGRLEQLLGPLEYRGALPALPSRVAPRRGRRRWIAAGALAAAAMAALLVLRPWRSRPVEHVVAPPPPRAAWAMAVLGAGATADGRPIPADAGDATLPVGAWLETGAARARLRVAGIGTVELSPGARARILETGPERHALALERGTLSAEVNAAPRRFAVETPRAVVTDLGCAFQLTVDERGRGRVVVTEGRVALSDRGAREVVVPAGAQCNLTERGFGAPYLSDAGAGFRAALARYDGDPRALPELLAESRARDRPTLEQLLPSAAPDARALIQARLRELDPVKPAPLRSAPKHKRPSPASPPAHQVEPAGKTEPAHKIEPAHKVEPAHKTEPGVKIKHDALQDLERSAE